MTTRPRTESPDDDDRWFDLTGLAAYSGLSLRTIRRYMDAPEHPLPTHHIQPPGSARGRVLVSKREFDAWVSSFPPRRSKVGKLARANLDARAWVRKLAEE
jgi:hypothetical protein